MRIIYITIIVLLATTGCANNSAMTDNDVSQDNTVKIETNKNIFKKPDDSLFLLKSVKNNSAYWLNTNKWIFEEAKNSNALEYKFRLKNSLLFGTVVTEKTQAPLNLLTLVAFVNAKKAAPDTEVVKKEYRIVNGNKVIYMEMNSTLMDIKYSYFGYYYSDEGGSTQLIVYTPISVANQYRQEIYHLLNGLVVQ